MSRKRLPALEGRFPVPDCAGIQIQVGRQLPEHGRRLLDSLGVTVTVAPDAPEFCCTDPHRQRRSRGSGHHRTDPRRNQDPTCEPSGRGEGAPQPHKEKDRSACSPSP